MGYWSRALLSLGQLDPSRRKRNLRAKTNCGAGHEGRKGARGERKFLARVPHSRVYHSCISYSTYAPARQCQAGKRYSKAFWSQTFLFSVIYLPFNPPDGSCLSQSHQPNISALTWCRESAMARAPRQQYIWKNKQLNINTNTLTFNHNTKTFFLGKKENQTFPKTVTWENRRNSNGRTNESLLSFRLQVVPLSFCSHTS